MRITLVSVYSRRGCTLKDVAGGFGTVFKIGDSPGARLLEWLKAGLIDLPSPVLGYVAAWAEIAGHEVVVCNLHRQAKRWDPVPQTDMAIVLSSMVDASAERAVLQELRDQGVYTVIIGAYATQNTQWYASFADLTVRGEPEAMGIRLFDRDLKGVVEAGSVADLDTLPWPQWKAFPVQTYRYAMLSSDKPTLPVLGMRGCAYRCGYCPYPVTAAYRLRQPQAILDEIQHLKQTYAVGAIAFRDPLLNANRNRLVQIARGIAPLGLCFSAEMRPDHLDSDLLELLHDSGLRCLQLGVESLDHSLLTGLDRRPSRLIHTERVIRRAEQLGIRVIANFILGLPDDTEAGMRATVAYAKQLNTYAVQFTVATPYPGTAMTSSLSSAMHTAQPDAFTGWEPVFEHPSMSSDAIRKLREWAYVSYHFRPRYLWRVLPDFVRHASSNAWR